MSEPEEIPFISLDMAGEEFKATPLNSQLFTFAGCTVLENGMEVENSTYNHIFLHTHGSDEADPEVMRGTYIFQPDIIEQMGAVMIRYGFPCRINQRVVQDCDIRAHTIYTGQVAEYEAEHGEDYIPDEWIDGGKE